MKSWNWYSPLALCVRRIALLYAVLMVCRVLFYLYNRSLLGALPTEELWPLLRGSLLFDTATVVYADGLFILLSLAPWPMKMHRSGWFRGVLFGYYAVVNSLFVIGINLSDAVYFHYTNKRFTADEIFFADNENSLMLVGQFLWENWWLVLIGIALIIVMLRLYGRKIVPESRWTGGRHYLRSLAQLALAVGLCIAGARGGLTRQTRPITLSNATLYTPDSKRANLVLSNPFCILRTIGSAGKIEHVAYYSAEELSLHFNPTHQPKDSVAVDLSGRNVMIFIMESMSAEHSAELHPELYTPQGEAGFTPFLDSLMRSSLLCRNMYANGMRSIQAMPSVLGSIPSFKTPFVLMPQALGESRQLPALLRDMGYETLFFCGSERGSMGFGAYARSAGVDRLISREDYEERHGGNDFDGYWGIWDEKFLQYAGEVLSETREPFCSTLFTLSSHHPFVIPEEYAEVLPKGYTKIHPGAAYEDLAFRRFYERFCREPWFQRTLFVFVADHVSSERYAAESREYPGNAHIFGFFHTPDGTLQGEITDVTQQLDIMPTVLGMLGNRAPYFAFGRDLLNEPERPHWSVSYDGGFRALTASQKVWFEEQRSSIEPRTDSRAIIREEVAESDSLTDTLHALVQQYYQHIEQKNYLPDSL